MLQKLTAKVHELVCTDEIDERTGSHKITKKAIGEGRVRKSVCCVGMSVKVLVIHCGIVQHIQVLELNFW